MRHKWMVMLVVVITTVATAQEAFRQYDDFKAQAEGWATLRLWTSLLNANAPQEDPLEEQSLICSDQSPAQDQYTRGVQARPTTDNLIRITNAVEHMRAGGGGEVVVGGAGHTTQFEITTISDKQHIESHGEDVLAAPELALLTEYPGDEIEEQIQSETEVVEPADNAQDDETDAESSDREQKEDRLITRSLNRSLAKASMLGHDPHTELSRSRVAVETRAVRRAVRVLQDIERVKQHELRIIRRNKRIESSSRTGRSLDSENSAVQIATDHMNEVLPAAAAVIMNPKKIISVNVDTLCTGE